MMSEPMIAQKAPIAVDVEAGETYHWCACGHSKTQPFCDGSHRYTHMTPIKFVAEVSETVYFCCCKHSESKPFCDGTHAHL